VRVRQLARSLGRAGGERIAIASRAVQRLDASLALLNPAAVLDRGYAIVTASDGAIVADAKVLAKGDAVALTFAKGRANATVTTTEER
jgi:exodeoxyribonuclease VII large subunit